MTSKDFFEEAKYEWCASEHQDKPLLNDMMRFAKLYHKEQLILSGVSQQRELLEAYQHFIDWNEEHDRKASTSERIESFIASNCG